MIAVRYDLVRPYDRFLYPDVDLSTAPEWSTLKRRFPAERVQEWLLDALIAAHPRRSDYCLHRAELMARQGLVVFADVDACDEMVSEGLARPDHRGSHQRLREFARQLQDERVRIRELLDRELGSNGDESQRLLPRLIPEQYETIERMVREDLAREDFRTCDRLLCVYLDTDRPQEALELYERYASHCEARGNHAIPSMFAAQEKLIGYLAQVDVLMARAMVEKWLRAKVCIVSALIRYHASFSDLFPLDKVDEQYLTEVVAEALEGDVDWVLVERDEQVVRLAWRDGLAPDLYLWLVFEEVFNTGVAAVCDYVVRPDDITADKARRFPSRRSSVNRYLERKRQTPPFRAPSGVGHRIGHCADHQLLLLTSRDEQDEFCRWAVAMLQDAARADGRA